MPAAGTAGRDRPPVYWREVCVFKLTADGKILCAWGGDFVTKDSLYRFLYAAVVP